MGIHKMQQKVFRPGLDLLDCLEVEKSAEIRLTAIIRPHCFFVDAYNLHSV